MVSLERPPARETCNQPVHNLSIRNIAHKPLSHVGPFNCGLVCPFDLMHSLNCCNQKYIIESPWYTRHAGCDVHTRDRSRLDQTSGTADLAEFDGLLLNILRLWTLLSSLSTLVSSPSSSLISPLLLLVVIYITITSSSIIIFIIISTIIIIIIIITSLNTILLVLHPCCSGHDDFSVL